MTLRPRYRILRPDRGSSAAEPPPARPDGEQGDSNPHQLRQRDTPPATPDGHQASAHRCHSAAATAGARYRWRGIPGVADRHRVPRGLITAATGLSSAGPRRPDATVGGRSPSGSRPAHRGRGTSVCNQEAWAGYRTSAAPAITSSHIAVMGVLKRGCIFGGLLSPPGPASPRRSARAGKRSHLRDARWCCAYWNFGFRWRTSPASAPSSDPTGRGDRRGQHICPRRM